MKRLQFMTLLAWPKFGWLQDVRVQRIDWGRSLVSLGGMTYMLLSSSYGQESVQQRVDAASGQQVFNNACRTCHTTKEGDNRLGPNLYKIIARKAGSQPDYNYSAAMKDAGFVWDAANLARFIANPDEVVPGNNMRPYTGLASADNRRKVVAFLLSVGAR